MLENMNKQGDGGHITREKHCKIYKIPLTLRVWSRYGNVKTNCSSYKGRRETA
jgi:hypothetical protein